MSCEGIIKYFNRDFSIMSGEDKARHKLGERQVGISLTVV